MNGRLVMLLSIVVSVAMLGVYFAAGGGSYEPREVDNPCDPRELSGERTQGEQIALSALDGAACELRVTREDLTLALASEEARESFLSERYVSDERLGEAARAGLERATEDAERLGALSGTQATIVGEVVQRLPYERVIELLVTVTGEDDPLSALTEAIDAGASLPGTIEDLRDELGGLIP